MLLVPRKIASVGGCKGNGIPSARTTAGPGGEPENRPLGGGQKNEGDNWPPVLGR
jgi:hypothetical protein